MLRHNRAMVTKKPKGLGLGLEALLGPKVSEAAAAPEGPPTSLLLTQLRARAWTKALCMSWPRASRAKV